MLRPIDCADEVVLMTAEMDVRTYSSCTIYVLVRSSLCLPRIVSLHMI